MAYTKKIAELFDVQRPAITKHLKNIFESGELDKKVVSSILEHTTKHGAIAENSKQNQLNFIISMLLLLLVTDYNRDSEITKDFYATVQNKFHFAITGITAAEIIYKRVDKTKSNIGLSTWKNAPKGRIIKTDTTIASKRNVSIGLLFNNRKQLTESIKSFH